MCWSTWVSKQSVFLKTNEKMNTVNFKTNVSACILIYDLRHCWCFSSNFSIFYGFLHIFICLGSWCVQGKLFRRVARSWISGNSLKSSHFLYQMWSAAQTTYVWQEFCSPFSLSVSVDLTWWATQPCNFGQPGFFSASFSLKMIFNAPGFLSVILVSVCHRGETVIRASH